MGRSDTERLRAEIRRVPAKPPVAPRARAAMLGYVRAPLSGTTEAPMPGGYRYQGPPAPEPDTWTGTISSADFPANLPIAPFDPTAQAWFPGFTSATVKCDLARIDNIHQQVETLADPAQEQVGGRLFVQDGIRTTSPAVSFVTRVYGPAGDVIPVGNGSTPTVLGGLPGAYLVSRRFGTEWAAEAKWNPCGTCFPGQDPLTLTIDYLAWTTDPVNDPGGAGYYQPSDPSAFKTVDLSLAYAASGPFWWVKVEDFAIPPTYGGVDFNPTTPSHGYQRVHTWLVLRCSQEGLQFWLYAANDGVMGDPDPVTGTTHLQDATQYAYYWHAPHLTSCYPLAIDFPNGVDSNPVAPDRGYTVVQGSYKTDLSATAYTASDLSTWLSTYLKSLSITRA